MALEYQPGTDGDVLRKKSAKKNLMTLSLSNPKTNMNMNMAIDMD
jgi:hypothetical protein